MIPNYVFQSIYAHCPMSSLASIKIYCKYEQSFQKFDKQKGAFISVLCEQWELIFSDNQYVGQL